MLEMCVNQGAGLQGLALQAAPRVLAMASHGDQQGELSLLWSLCATLVDLGYPVAVLDASAEESAANPGLAQLLDDTGWRGDQSSVPLSWSVVPAAQGLQQLCLRRAPGLELDALGGLFQGFGVVVIYAHADILARLLPDSGIAPLLSVSTAKMSCVTAYQALKQMLLNAQLRPTIAFLGREPWSDSATARPSPIKNLQDCAMTFLDYRIHVLSVRERQEQESPSDDMRRLALRLLENAMPLPRHPFVGSH